MTKVTTKYYVFRDKEKGEYLAKYQSKGSIAYHAEYTDEINRALEMSLKGYEMQKKQLKLLAKALGAEIIEVNATFELTYPNGDEIREIEKNGSDGLGDFGEFLKRRLTEAILGEGE